MLLKIKVIFDHLYFTTFLITIVIYVFKKLVDEKNDKVKFGIINETNEEYISVTYGCIRFIDS